MKKIGLVVACSMYVLSVRGYDVYDSYLFVKRSIQDIAQIGAVLPTSRSAACELVRPLQYKSGMRRVLEVGAGTGAITDVILEQINETDRLDVIEIDPELCAVLQKKYAQRPNVSVYGISILDWNPAYSYDIIISTLPFTNFSLEELDAILHHYERLSQPGTVLSYLEYMSVGWKRFFINTDQAANLKMKLDYVDAFRKRNRTSTVSVYANVPPTFAHHIVLHNSVI